MLDFDVTSAASEQSEGERIALALHRRDLAVLHALVEQFGHRLLRYLIYLTGRREGVDDLVQETWLRVLERGASFDGRARFEPWLFTIARNLAIDETRRKRNISLDADDGEDALSPPLGSQEPSPFMQAARSQDAALLARSLETLGPVYREALLLRFQEDLSLAEIAAIVGAPVPTVSSRIQRGLAKLRVQLEERNQ